MQLSEFTFIFLTLCIPFLYYIVQSTGPKKGFSIPMNEWLITSLKDWAEDLFSSDVFKKNVTLNKQLINNYWMMHKSKTANYHKRIWNILVLISWLNKKGFSIF